VGSAPSSTSGNDDLVELNSPSERVQSIRGDADTIRLIGARVSASARPTWRGIDFSDIADSSPAQLKAMRRLGRPPLGDQARQLIAIRGAGRSWSSVDSRARYRYEREPQRSRPHGLISCPTTRTLPTAHGTRPTNIPVAPEYG
jgi:hypothetical protein